MEPECPAEKSGAAHCDVTAVRPADTRALDCSVAVAQSPDLSTVNCDVTAVLTSDPSNHGRGLAVAEGLAPPTVGDDVTAGVSGTAGAPHPGLLQRTAKAPAKLCGYLHKLGGPLKGWKSRWFVYEERNCHLFYYRTAQDASPLGHIALTDATFGYPIEAGPGTFHIQTPQRTFVLKAVNRETMMYWLQQLQLRRWRHRDVAGRRSAQVCADTHREGTAGGTTFCADDFLTIVKVPTGLVGEEAARQPAPRQQATLSNVSFKHPFTEIQNSVRSLRLSRLSQELSRSVFHYELSEEATPTDPEGPAPNTPTQEGPAPNTPTQEGPAPNTPTQEDPAPNTPTQEGPAPNTPTQEGPAPNTPTQESPAPNTPTQEGPAPNTPTQEGPAPNTPTQEGPAPNTPTQEGPAPNTPTQEGPAPNTPTQEGPAPNTPTQEGPAPNTPTQESPAPNTPTQESPAPKSPAQGSQNAASTVPPEPLDLSATSSSLLAAQGEDREEGRRSPCPSPNLQTRRNRAGHSASLPRHCTQNRLSHLQQEEDTLSEELRIQKKLVKLLHQALEEAHREKRGSAVRLASEEEEEALRACERRIMELTAQLQAQRDQQGALQDRLAQREAHEAELEQHLLLMAEKNRAKQEVVLLLSQQVEACLADPLRPVTNSMETATFTQLQEEIRQLQDDVTAFRTQNKFLNSEIYQLTWLWRRSSEQEKNLMMKCAYLESRNFQKDRRYLGVLRTLQESEHLDSIQQEALQSLIEEALLGDMKNRLKLDPIREYDDYGFKMVPDFDLEDVKLLAKIQALEIPSHNALQREGSVGDTSLSARWAQYLSSCPVGDLAPVPELKPLLRAGVPPEYRRQAWLRLVWSRTRYIREAHPHRYRQMLEKSGAAPHPASRQIQLDLHRTLTGNQHFSSPSDPAVQQLHRILLAFSWQSPAIGYCQGLNRLAALALLVLQDEEEAFWCLVAVVETIMPKDYYSKTLAASQADQRVLKDLMLEKLPRLAAHLEELQVDLSLITFNWFLVVFIETLSSHILLQIWDSFLYEGIKVLFRYALALLKYREEDILKIQDKVEMYQYLRFFTKTVTDGRRLMNIAFSGMNPLAMKLLIGRRAAHLERMRAELSELERIQSEYTAQNRERSDKELYATTSEDEDEV